MNDKDQSSNAILVDIYDKNTNEYLNYVGLNVESVTLSVGVDYIFDFYINGPYNFIDAGLKLAYDKDYINLNKYDQEDLTDHKYDFRARKQTEGTDLEMKLDDYSRTIMLTLV